MFLGRFSRWLNAALYENASAAGIKHLEYGMHRWFFFPLPTSFPDTTVGTTIKRIVYMVFVNGVRDVQSSSLLPFLKSEVYFYRTFPTGQTIFGSFFNFFLF